MASDSPEARFHSKLFDKLDDYIHAEDTPYHNVSIEDRMEDGGRADIFVESQLTESFIIEVKRDDKNPLKREHIAQARDYAKSKNVGFFAVCNSNDYFLFNYRGEMEVTEIDFHYLDLREGDIYERTFGGLLPKMLQAVQYLSKHDHLPKQKVRKQIVGVIRSFHTSIWPTYKELAQQTYGRNAEFTEYFDEWVAENNYSTRDETEQYEIAAKQHAYLLANKILFYDLVKERTPDEIETQSGFPLNSLYQTSTGTNIDVTGIKPRIEKQFKQITEEIDYEPVFDDSETIFRAFPENRKTQRAIQTLLENFESKRIEEVNEDLLGELYQELIPKDERRQLGQFYTPPSIAEALVRWAIDSTESDSLPRILDPASGSGTFPVETYKYLKSHYPESSHQEIIDSIFAIDINKFPIHLTAFNLAIRDITAKTDRIHTKNNSFFDISPTEETLSAFTQEGEKFTQTFDAVVGNPPYIFHQNLFPDKEHFRRHLKSYEDEDGNKPYYGGSDKFDTYTDAYVYFVSHALRFLDDGGKLAFIVSAKWLDVEYGFPFQQFLFDNTKIHSVVTFSSRSFEDALVNTSLLLLEKESDSEAREKTVTDFIHIKERIPPTDLVSTINHQRTVPEGKPYEFDSRTGYRVLSRRQSDLCEDGPGKLGHYLSAPRPAIDLINSNLFAPLGELPFSRIRRGYMTGANSFFILDEDDVDQWDIDPQFLKPAIKSVKDLHALATPKGGLGLYILDLREFIEETRPKWKNSSSDISLVNAVKNRLKEEGHEKVHQYIEYGESNEIDEMYNPKQRKVWFQLPELVAPDVLHPVFYNEDLYTIQNTGKLVPSNAILCVWFDEHQEAMRGIMNSSLYKMTLEIWGRKEGGGALQFLPDEVKTIPVPDPRQLDKDAREAIIQAADKLEFGKETGQDELDKAVLDGFNVPISVDDLQQMQTLMTKKRVEGAQDTTVLIKELDEFDEYDLEGFINQNDNQED
ncbi:class I SAM-dependent DNA methyltransferase [Halobium palmae]|uniref:Class I SAM-dependent DNA methyltransferase n=1 Tax=Halobium palmae TaxID=1776492 RepID=A0ABD5RVF5_9EURY